ncbi:hypothetical protein M422DRAFT_272092 [Sphaerobolus stellatus SS14]|uniref:Uncharacterized protein n=1 Tax=Sphaerobolus stellatus (strain SS14) TaxID=990650 RepID=A0A0C9UNE0_SPHS4|nr:hypothetical protein M422DRAFT_272092 [Sphaerobolus stellatus SS14]
MARQKGNAAAAVRAREAHHHRNTSVEVIEISSDEDCDAELCNWVGGVNHCLSSDSGFSWTDSESNSNSEFAELEGEKLLQSIDNQQAVLQAALEAELQQEIKDLAKPTLYNTLTQTKHTTESWKIAEKNQGLGYTGTSSRTRQRREQEARKKEVEDAELRKSHSAAMMRAFLKPKHPANPIPPHISPAPVPLPPPSNTIFIGYDSDKSEDPPLTDDGSDADDENNAATGLEEASISNFHVHAPLPLKRRKLNVPARVACK